MKKLNFVIALLAVSTIFNSCVKNRFDTPLTTDRVDPHLPVNMTIAQLSAIAYDLGSGGYRTMGDSTISGIVTADDRSGNFYKQIVIQDSTGGIVITMNQTGLYADYAIGRKVYVKLKGLMIVDYKGLPEVAYAVTTVGSFSTTGIPSAFIPTTVIPASYPNTVTPLSIRLSDAATNPFAYVNLLVKFDDVEFAKTSSNTAYAAPSTVATATPRYMVECASGTQMEMYNSGYANFQPYLTPTGHGSITGIMSYYGSATQFLIRDTTDVQLTDPRQCDL